MEKYYVAHKALLVNPQGKVLVLKSSGATSAENPGRWDLPGGCMEAGDTSVDTLAREVMEEVGIAIDGRRAKYVTGLVSHGFGSKATEFVYKNFYSISVDGADPKLSWEHEAFEWIDPRQPVPERITGFVRDVIHAYVRQERIAGVDDRIKGRTGYGLVQMIYGNGKGKTTASLGQAIRCAGSGRKVLIVYFDKGGTSHYSDRAIIKSNPNITFEATGRDRIDPVTGRFDFSITDEDRAEAKRGLDVARTALREGGHDLVILDEINSTSSLGMLSEQEVLDVIDNKLEDVEVIMTGRNPFESFLDRAHIVTEMKLERHYFYSGVPAREGLDY